LPVTALAWRLCGLLPCSHSQQHWRSESTSPDLEARRLGRSRKARRPRPSPGQASAVGRIPACYLGPPAPPGSSRRDLLDAEHGRHSRPRFRGHPVRPGRGKVRPVERHGEEENASRGTVNVVLWRPHAGLRWLVLERANPPRGSGVGENQADKGAANARTCECSRWRVLLGLKAASTVMSSIHARPQRADGRWKGRGSSGALSQGPKVDGTFDAFGIGCPNRHAFRLRR